MRSLSTRFLGHPRLTKATDLIFPADLAMLNSPANERGQSSELTAACQQSKTARESLWFGRAIVEAA
jgi:hypothetical protein